MVFLMQLCFNANEELELNKPTKWPLCYLKEVEIIGNSCRRCDVGLIIHLIESAVSLEKIIVNPCIYSTEHCHCRQPKNINIYKMEEETRDHAMKQLKQIVPSTIQFLYYDVYFLIYEIVNCDYNFINYKIWCYLN